MHSLLIIGYVWPEPNSSAAGQRMLQLISSFQQVGYSIHFASPTQRGEHEFDLSMLNVSTSNIQLNDSSFDEFIIELNPKVVLFDRFMMEEQFGWRVAEHCPNALRLLDSEDLHFLRHARQQWIKKNPEAFTAKTENLPLELLHSDQAKREIASIYRCDLTLTISHYEMDLLIEQFNITSPLLIHIPLLIAESSIQDSKNSLIEFDERKHFICIGNFRHAPNWDAVLQLKQLWPDLRKKFKSLQLPLPELHIYGAYPPPKASQLHNEQQGFLIKGWATDANAVMQQARVCLAPIRFGAGIKGKLLEAMINGTASVTTSIGSEGMMNQENQLEWNGTINDDSQAFIESAFELYTNKTLWQESQKNGFQRLKQEYLFDSYHQQLQTRISELQANLDQHRQSNFIGQMLQHHTMKSTQYMAQWIEAKNKLN